MRCTQVSTLLPALLVAIFGAACQAQAPAERPNIVLILADDLGYGDPGCYNDQSKIPTPSIDQLAAEGTRFTDAHSPSSVCSPTRYGILTGRYAWRTRLQASVLWPWDPPLIEAGRLTLPAMLKQHGYRTGCVGKWHLGWEWPVTHGELPSEVIRLGRNNGKVRQGIGERIDLSGRIAGGPLSRGFDSYFGDDVPNFPPYSFIEDDRLLGTDWQPKPSGLFGHSGPMAADWALDEVMPALVERAVQWLGARGEAAEREPFFLFMPLTAPHTPIAPAESFVGKSEAGRYGDFVHEVDWAVGRVRAALERHGFGENTLVIFTSDNGSPARDGTHMSGPAGSVPTRYGHEPSRPWRGMKSDVWEAGHRVPFIAHWPGRIPEGRESAQSLILVDLFATIARLLGHELDEDVAEDSIDMSSALFGDAETGALSVRDHLVHHSGNGTFGLRVGSWKLIPDNLGSGGFTRPGRVRPKEGGPQGQLYDLSVDPAETTNLWDARPEIVAELSERLAEIRSAGRTRPDVARIAPENEAQPRRPNILLAIADDWGYPHAGAYGDEVVRTPCFDRIAREGVHFRSAFVSSPSCTPSRNAILTGQWHWRLGAGANLHSTLDVDIPVYPRLLEEAGYRVGHTSKAWGPGRLAPGGWQRGEHPAGRRYPSFEKFMEERSTEEPFCFWLGTTDPHRGYDLGSGERSGIAPGEIALPACFPDSPEVRGDVADYYFEVQRFDTKVAAALALLEARGELDNTIVVMTGDHGMPFPRAKSNLYDLGTRVPLAVRWGGALAAGGIVEDLVSLTDLAPTFLEVADVEAPEVMTGRSLLQALRAPSTRAEPVRDHVLVGKERHTPAQAFPSMAGYPCRGVRTDDYLYLRNFAPDRWPAGDPAGSTRGPILSDTDDGPTRQFMVEHRRDPKVAPLYELAFGKRPAEELYDLAVDPEQLVNLAGDPAHGATMSRLSAQLMSELRATGDPRASGGGHEFDRYPYFGGTRLSKLRRRGAQPDIVVVMVDDMGFSDLGCYGGEIQTPNLDALAAGGLRFTQFANTARCCPTRASLLTGLYAHQAGVGAMVSDEGAPGYRGRLSESCLTIAEALRPAGYRSYLAGKWHVTPFDYASNRGSDPATWPLQRGFDEFFGTLCGAGSLFHPGGLMRGNRRVLPPDSGFYYTDAVTDEAIARVGRTPANRPLFLYLAYTAPHWPLHAHPEDIARYEGVYDQGWDSIRAARLERQVSMGIVAAGTQLSPRDSRVPAWEDVRNPAWQARRMQVYAAMIDRVDQNVGRLVTTLRQTGRLSNTLFLFLADNGGCAEGVSSRPGHPRYRQIQGHLGDVLLRPGNSPEIEPGGPDTFASYGRGWANASNTPFHHYKQDTFRGGVATPLIVHWPAGLRERGALRHQLGHVVDIMATCLEVAGATYPAARDAVPLPKLPGRSLVPAFADRPLEREALYWEHLGNRAIRAGDLELVSARGGPWRLYDLATDATELHDLAHQRPEVAAELAARWQEWAERSQVLRK